jgi:hypothetical protein
MRKPFITLATISTVLTFGATNEVYAGGFAARARVTVGQCIGSWWRCAVHCPGYIDGFIPPSSNPAADKLCMNRCDANHAACIDQAMDLSPGRRLRASKRGVRQKATRGSR